MVLGGNGVARFTSGLVLQCLVGCVVVGPIHAAELEALAPRITLVLPDLTLDTAETPSISDAPSPTASTGRLIAGGALGGAAGFAVGGGLSLIPSQGACEDEGDDVDLCRGIWFFGGGSTVGAFGVPLGVHIANGRRGKLLPSILASVGIGALGVIAAASLEESDAAAIAVLCAVPVAQVATSIVIERKTARSKASRP